MPPLKNLDSGQGLTQYFFILLFTIVFNHYFFNLLLGYANLKWLKGHLKAAHERNKAIEEDKMKDDKDG